MTSQNRPWIHGVTAALGLVVAMPVIYFVAGNILKYELGLLPQIAIFPVHPVVLIGCGLAALILNAWTVMQFRITHEGDRVWFMFGLKNRPWNVAVAVIAALSLAALCGYVLIENLTRIFGR